MTTDVLKLQGDYRIKTASNGAIYLDVSSGGTVYITGNLDVQGTTTQIESVNATVKDSTIMLNQGDPLVGGHITNGFSGLQIARGNSDSPYSSSYIQWNDNSVWNGTGQISNVTGVFEFRIGPHDAAPQYSALKFNALRIDESSASTIGGRPRLNIFGQENPTSVISVSGTQDYETRVLDDDDIPNKAYVDQQILATPTTASEIVRGHSYVKLLDTYYGDGASKLVAVLDGNPLDPLGVVSTGNVIMSLTGNVAEFSGIQLVGNQILPTGINSDLILGTNTTTSRIILQAPILFSSSLPPVMPDPGETNLYAANPGGGGTGMYYITSSTLGAVTQDEFVSRKKALVYSIIF